MTQSQRSSWPPNVLRCIEAFDVRREKLLATPTPPQHLYGTTALIDLFQNRNLVEANVGVRHLANWFDRPPPLGRDHQGECDFAALKLSRIHHLFQNTGRLEPSTSEQIKRFFLTQDFQSKHPSENHVLIFRVSRYLMAGAYPKEKFQAYGRSGAELQAEDQEWLKQFIRYRAKCGWGEFDSAHYLGPDWEALAGLHDFAPDETLRRLAGMMMEVLLADMAVDSLDGMYGGAHGRIYPHEALDHAREDTAGFQYLYFGTAEPPNPAMNPLVDALTCGYRPHPLVIDVALNRRHAYENRERKHLHNMSDTLPVLSLVESIRKYTYWTPDYVMGCVQHQDDYPPGTAAIYAHHQQHEWDLTFRGHTRARVFSHHPGDFNEHNHWTGDLGCGCGKFFQNRTALAAIYNIPPGQPHQEIHLYVPRASFDEVIEEAGRIYVRAGEGYAMLAASDPFEWTVDGEWKDCEVRLRSPRCTVVCEAGSAAEFGSFPAFRREVATNLLTFEAEPLWMKYVSKRAGTLSLDGSGKKKLNDQEIDLSYQALDCPYLQSGWESECIELTNGTQRRSYDFSTATIESTTL